MKLDRPMVLQAMKKLNVDSAVIDHKIFAQQETLVTKFYMLVEKNGSEYNSRIQIIVQKYRKI